MQFLKIDKQIEEVVKASAFLAKLKGNDEKTMMMLENKYKEDISNLNNAVAVCFYQWFLTGENFDPTDTNSVFKLTFDVINKIEDTLEENPEYWLLLILKYKIISFMNFNEDDLILDLENLIELQSIQEKQPYYLVTNLLLANICYSKEKYEYAIEILEDILLENNERIVVLNNFFEGFLIEFRNLVLRSDDEKIQALLGEIQNRFF